MPDIRPSDRTWRLAIPGQPGFVVAFALAVSLGWVSAMVTPPECLAGPSSRQGIERHTAAPLWRRTASGWEDMRRWPTRERAKAMASPWWARFGSVHPLVVALLQVLFVLGVALAAWPVPADAPGSNADPANRPNSSVRPA